MTGPFGQSGSKGRNQSGSLTRAAAVRGATAWASSPISSCGAWWFLLHENPKPPSVEPGPQEGGTPAAMRGDPTRPVRVRRSPCAWAGPRMPPCDGVRRGRRRRKAQASRRTRGERGARRRRAGSAQAARRHRPGAGFRRLAAQRGARRRSWRAARDHRREDRPARSHPRAGADMALHGASALRPPQAHPRRRHPSDGRSRSADPQVSPWIVFRAEHGARQADARQAREAENHGRKGAATPSSKTGADA